MQLETSIALRVELVKYSGNVARRSDLFCEVRNAFFGRILNVAAGNVDYVDADMRACVYPIDELKLIVDMSDLPTASETL